MADQVTQLIMKLNEDDLRRDWLCLARMIPRIKSSQEIYTSLFNLTVAVSAQIKEAPGPSVIHS